jgi:hypothetical protein
MNIINASDIYRDCLVYEIIDLLPINEASVFRIMTADLRDAVHLVEFPYIKDLSFSTWKDKLSFYMDNNFIRAIDRFINITYSFGQWNTYMVELRLLYGENKLTIPEHLRSSHGSSGDDVILFISERAYQTDNATIFTYMANNRICNSCVSGKMLLFYHISKCHRNIVNMLNIKKQYMLNTLIRSFIPELDIDDEIELNDSCKHIIEDKHPPGCLLDILVYHLNIRHRLYQKLMSLQFFV